MPDLEISIPYKAVSKPLFWTLCISWIVIGFITACLLYVGIAVSDLLILHNNLYTIGKFVFFILGGILYVYAPFALYLKYTRLTYIFLNSDGLGVPGSLLGRSHWLPWSEMRQADMDHFRSADDLVLTFAHGGKVRIETDRMTTAEKEQLLMAIEVWAVKAVWSPNLTQFRTALENKKVGLQGPSYTQLWEEELQRRFNVTTFIPLQPGTSLRSGSIKILRQIAFGGFSAVYLAEDSDQKRIIIKEAVTASSINKAQNGDSKNLTLPHEKALEFFRREAELLAKLKNEKIARVLDNFVENDKAYLVLEYIPGETLRDYVKRTCPQSEETVSEWMLQMAEILQYLHEQNPPVIHRDFTPDNLLLRDDRAVVLIDFGAANQFLGIATGTLVGKQSYMPPEQVRGKSEPKSDLYALGCTAHFLLTGQAPEPLSVSHPRSLNYGISERLDALIANLTAQEISERTNTASDVVNALNEISNSTAGVVSVKLRKNQISLE